MSLENSHATVGESGGSDDELHPEPIKFFVGAETSFHGSTGKGSISLN